MFKSHQWLHQDLCVGLSVSQSQWKTFRVWQMGAGETLLLCDHVVLICFLHFLGLQLHQTIHPSVVSGSCLGLTHHAFVLLHESLWFHCSEPVLSVVKCYNALCLALSNRWRHQLLSRCLSSTAFNPQLLPAQRRCSCARDVWMVSSFPWSRAYNSILTGMNKMCACFIWICGMRWPSSGLMVSRWLPCVISDDCMDV